jgi:ABC-type Fe3+/spermidine/putrescine transport system ATPase subunit
MGTTNVIAGVVEARDGARARVRAGAGDMFMADADAREGEAVTLCLRPEALRIIAAGEPMAAGEAQVEATVTNAEFIGALTRLDVKLRGGTPLKVAVLDGPHSSAAAGSTIALAYDPSRVTVFGPGTA